MANPSVGVAIITYKAKHHLASCLPPLIHSPLKPKVLVVNSSSHDGTVEEAQRLGAETLVIPRAEFNHGLTRERARKALNTDVVVMVTPDAYASGLDVLEKLIAPIVQGQASIAYARQLPHVGAGFFETFAREFNYPASSHTRGFNDASRYGVYTVFCSNAFAAYSNAALDEIGGFQNVLTGEDTLGTAKLILRGHRIAYVAEACVHHSHSYTLAEEFRRHFDTGLARKTYSAQIAFAGKDSKRGNRYVKCLLSSVWKHKPHLLPYAVMHILSKWCGYRLGAASQNAPTWFKKALSSQDFYWAAKNK